MVLSFPAVSNWIRITKRTEVVLPVYLSSRPSVVTLSFNSCKVFARQFASSSTTDGNNSVQQDSLKLLEWDKVCDLVASFAATLPGREASRAQLLISDRTYEDSLNLLKETEAAVEMHNHGGCRLFFTGVQLHLVESAIRCARRGLPMQGDEAVAVAAMFELVEALQDNLKAAIKEDSDWYNRFMPLSEVIMELHTNRQLAKMIRRVVDDDGSIKDSASSTLKRARDQVRLLENKLNQLMDSIIRKEKSSNSSLEVSSADGRWCIRSDASQRMGFEGLLLSSDSAKGNILEPLVAVPLNDELLQARGSVAKAEAEVLMKLTEKMLEDFDGIETVPDNIIYLDAVNARAAYSISYGGAYPALCRIEDNHSSTNVNTKITGEETVNTTFSDWLLYMPKAYHPLLLHQHRTKLKDAKKKIRNGHAVTPELPPPVPVDFIIGRKTKVVVITGPNTGGKTICLKTIGLAALMAKSGLYVLSSESIRIPWFDAIYADIGDEQSLSQSLSTFSGHLKQISNIRSLSTKESLVLLDEIGAGTNPLEGAAIGMAVLESFSSNGALLTIATTHHGELKSLKYSNDGFENACMEFDEVNLKPTFKILWGVPGRSNAINISERLGLLKLVVSRARSLYGSASSELDEVIFDMEKYKQSSRKLFLQSQQYLKISRILHEKLTLSKKKISDHNAALQHKNMRMLSEIGSIGRSILHKKVRERRSYGPLTSVAKTVDDDVQSANNKENMHPKLRRPPLELKEKSNPVANSRVPKVGEAIVISSLGRKGVVLSVDVVKDEVVVQVNFVKMKLKLNDVVA